jgi:purine catabolism regulator
MASADGDETGWSDAVHRETAPAEAISVRVLIEHDVVHGATVAAGAAGIDRLVSHFNVMSVPTILPWVKPDEFLLLTGYPLPHNPAAIAQLLRELDARGVAGVGIKFDEWVAALPDEALQAAEEMAFPVLVVPATVAFNDILSRGLTLIANSHADMMATVQHIHARLLDVVLQGGGQAALTHELAELLDCVVVIADQDGHVMTTSPPDAAAVAELELVGSNRKVRTSVLEAGLHRHTGTGRAWVTTPIRAGALLHGHLVVAQRDRPLRPMTERAVEQAAVVAALEITRQQTVTAVERQFASNALQELISGTCQELEEAAARGRVFGWDLERPVVVVVAQLAVDDTTRRLTPAERGRAMARALQVWTATVAHHDEQAASGGFITELVAVLGGERPPLEAARVLQAELTALTPYTYTLGVSRLGLGPGCLPQGYQEARVALTRGAAMSGQGTVTSFEALGLFRLLGQLPTGELSGFVDDALGPLLELPAEERDDLLHTVEVLLRHHCNVAESSRILHYHYNTLRYRITKLERLLGPFTADPDLALQLAVALQIQKVNPTPN